jgi:hypothetical protein
MSLPNAANITPPAQTSTILASTNPTNEPPPRADSPTGPTLPTSGSPPPVHRHVLRKKHSSRASQETEYEHSYYRLPVGPFEDATILPPQLGMAPARQAFGMVETTPGGIAQHDAAPPLPPLPQNSPSQPLLAVLRQTPDRKPSITIRQSNQQNNASGENSAAAAVVAAAPPPTPLVAAVAPGVVGVGSVSTSSVSSPASERSSGRNSMSGSGLKIFLTNLKVASGKRTNQIADSSLMMQPSQPHFSGPSLLSAPDLTMPISLPTPPDPLTDPPVLQPADGHRASGSRTYSISVAGAKPPSPAPTAEYGTAAISHEVPVQPSSSTTVAPISLDSSASGAQQVLADASSFTITVEPSAVAATQAPFSFSATTGAHHANSSTSSLPAASAGSAKHRTEFSWSAASTNPGSVSLESQAAIAGGNGTGTVGAHLASHLQHPSHSSMALTPRSMLGAPLPPVADVDAGDHPPEVDIGSEHSRNVSSILLASQRHKKGTFHSMDSTAAQPGLERKTSDAEQESNRFE